MQSHSTARRPNFFLAGAMKAGTTSMHHYLGHRDLAAAWPRFRDVHSHDALASAASS